MTQSPPPFQVRMPPDLKARVTEAARRNHRSLNGEIIFQLERVFPDPAAGEDKA